MEPKIDPPSGPRSAGQFAAGWNDKVPDNVELRVRTHFFRRHWVRRSLFGLFILGGVVGAVVIARFNDWRDSQMADFAHQRQSLQSFLHSAEFTQFAQAMDAQLVALINFIAARPHEAQNLLPAVAAQDKARHQLPWTSEIVPLPLSTATDPAAVARATRNLCDVLTRHGYLVDEAARKSGRQVFLRVVVPFAQRFLSRERGNMFHAIMLDRRMQEDALSQFATFHGSSVTAAEVERIFALYGIIGPTMWQAIQREQKEANRFNVPGPAPGDAGNSVK